MSSLFVTGTDTGVGKTLVAGALLHRLHERHARVVGMKAVSAGGDEDVLALLEASSIEVPRALCNPYALAAPVSPHIAAQRDGVTLALPRIVDALAALRRQADAVVVEGAGGFRVPLGPSLDGADLAVALALPVVLVVGLRLGCLNHAVLTADAVRSRGLRLAGWVANRIDPDMPEQEANLAWLRDTLGAPCLGDIPYGADARSAARLLALPA